jgi:two-component system sensor histidine kinase MprB
MPLRRRLTLAAAAAVAVAVTLAAVVAYVAVRNELRGQVDDALKQQLALRTEPRPPFGGFGRGFGPLPARRGGPTPYIQLVAPGGTVLGQLGSEQAALPVDARVRDVANGRAGPFLADTSTAGVHVRVLTAPLAEGGAVEFGRALTSVDHVLERLRLILLLVCLGGIALAAGLGRLVSRSFVAPIANVTEAARHIAATEDLGRRIEVTSQDEVGELAAHFNAMLDTLERSIAAQRQLVADASHELRTPITSLRTNIEVLAETEDLPRDERSRLLADVQEQTTELGMLVADLIELARGDQPRRDTEDVRLDELVSEAVARARRHAPGVRFTTRLEPAVVEGSRDRLARAVNNLLDNAAGHSPPGAVVEVDAGPDGVRVRDHGAGVAEQDIPHLFDRFYRGVSARGHPGSGLGLAIVRQVAEQHQGSVRAANAPGGGAEFVLALPTVAPSTGELWATPSV